ncbi:STAS/SEC14 domain-containing protein [Leisingera aquaemixtae]|uniref:STAS/SEC14 domain-containing protein n=1 Tax=Leisingera aquaemixtae TaxID=1396826 RepID=UPI001C9677BF|nr:STAS/SEC14 domain-containing protein [Leisingera aquaemixtae]MBY6065885.1 STAS/SEC14 domain-containing protein [Leisingera aquaemixtae]
MIQVETQMGGSLIEVRLTGKIRGEDYEKLLVPAVEAALKEHDRIRVLAILDQGFGGYDLSAVWADTKLGLGHWSGFDRCAVAADQGWVQTAIRVAAPLLPCPVQVFGLDQVEAARRWLRESLGTVHIIDLGGPCLQIKLMGQVDPEAYQRAGGDLDARLREREGFRLLIDLTEFDGWQGLSAMAAHFNLARTHVPLLDRAAVVGDKAWQHMAQRVAARILKAETRFFPSEEIENAKAWLTAG